MPGKLVHLMGICGTAMGSLAGLLKEMGYEVRGSDQNVYPPMSTRLQELGISILSGYKPENLNPRPDLVIVGNVMSRTHSEVQALLQTDIPYMSLPQALGEFVIKDRHSVVVTGTHGKTTTTAMASWVLQCAKFDPGFLIGGVPLNFPQTFAIGKGNYFVIEGDEYDTAFFDKVPKFIHYRPRSVILTSIEFDHADIYKDLNDVKKAFERLMILIPHDGLLVYRAEDENIQSILSQTKCQNVQSYGIDQGDWQLGEVKFTEAASEFDVVHKGRKTARVKSQLFGEYNLLNALSVFALGHSLNISSDTMVKAFASFKGVKRRQEIIGRPNDITVIDDFAHHPTAVAVTIDGVKKRYKNSKIIAVFEPRSATSRRKVFQEDFARALCKADEVIVSVPYDQSKIPEGDRFDSRALLEDCQKVDPQIRVTLGANVDEIVASLKATAQPTNVILLMSNGGFGGIYERILKELDG